jgi:hypothetical protein
MKLLFLPLIFIILTSCKKEPCSGAQKAIFKDLSGLDGCGLVIELENGKKLEPINLSEFSITPENGRKIWVKYHLFEGGSICMVGDIVKVDCITERD